MRKLKLIKVVAPELVAYITHGGEKVPDYACPECGMGVADNYSFCPYCGAEFDWKHESEASAAFRRLVESVKRINI